jgi:prepilin-type N-terminal cleavage/methylation domain-containing protein
MIKHRGSFMACFYNKARGFTLVELMVVIVIIGILAAVAVPKFLDASSKAKASEFPTVLTAVYTGEMAYQAERGSYASTMTHLKDSSCVEVPGTTRWFTYQIPLATATSFRATARVKTTFGGTTTSDTAAIDHTNSKWASPNLKKFTPSWR